LGDTQRTTILILISHYLPAYKSGGPVRSVAGLVEALAKDFEFKIVCSDRDLGDAEPFKGEPVGCWYNYGHAKVMRLPPGIEGVRKLFDVMRRESYDILYLNSVWASMYAILPMVWRALRLLPQKSVVLAPRGMLSAEALRIKSLRKRLYISLAKATRLFDAVLWQAASEYEKADILRVIGTGEIKQAASVHLRNEGGGYTWAEKSVMVAPDVLSCSVPAKVNHKRRTKTPGELRVVTLARVCRMKNTHYAIKLFQRMRGRVVYDIYGPLEDRSYLAECHKMFCELPTNVTVRFLGGIPHEEVASILSAYHVFLFPTLGENYGHVVVEAMGAGCVVIMSDRTPWRDLEDAGAGWVLPLSAPERFTTVLETAVGWSDQEYQRFSDMARRYATAQDRYDISVGENKALFDAAAMQCP
jgi:glycosyltransferase involved in cell wall biosynthesis